MLSDLRYAVRRLGASPGFTIIAILTLALGIGANTAIFSLVNAVLLQRQPFRDPATLFELGRTGSVPWSDYLVIAEQSRELFEDVAAFAPLRGALAAAGGTGTVFGELVSGNYFPVLGLTPLRGRLLQPADDHGEPVVVISESAWRARFGGREDIAGVSARLNGRPVTIVGVAPHGFRGLLMPGLIQEQIWVSMAYAPGGAETGQGAGGMPEGTPRVGLAARTKPGVSVPEAQAAMDVMAQHLPQTPGGPPVRFRVTAMEDKQVDSSVADVAVPMARGLLLMVALVLVIACANLANLVLARGSTRGGELAVRQALGASRMRIVRQLMTENLLLAAGGGAVALLSAFWITRYLATLNPPMLEGITIAIDPAVDAGVVAYTLAASLLTVAVFGLVPSLRASRPDLAPLMSGGISGVTGGGTGLLSMRGLLMIAQVSISLVLLVVAGLLARSFIQATSVDPGFRQEGLATTGVDLTLRRFDESQGRAFYRRLEENAASIPGVSAVTFADKLPAGTAPSSAGIWIEGEPRDGRQRRGTSYIRVGPRFFEMLDIPVAAGRTFDNRDEAGAPLVAIVNEFAARRLWKDGPAIGQRIWLTTTPEPLTIVGVARDTGTGMFGDQTSSLVFLPAKQHYSPRMQVVARTHGDERTLLGDLERAVREVDPDVAIVHSNTVREQLALFKYPFRIGAGVVGTLGLLALLLAAFGLYGVMSYLVAQRTREVGIRLAIGATPGNVLIMIVRQGMRVVLAGLAVGALLAVPASIALGRALYGVNPVDPVTFVVVPLFLAVMAAVACFVPGRRASRVDPMIALRRL